MSSAPGSSTFRLIAALERDRHLAQAASAVVPLEVPDRRPTRVDAAVPLRLDWVQLRQDHEAVLAQFVANYRGAPLEGSGTDRTALHRTVLEHLAVAAAETSAQAQDELTIAETVGQLRTLLTAGDGQRAVAAISCPGCYCWSLLPVRAPGGGWRAACRNVRCAITPQIARTWTLREIAAHQLRETRAA